ncbi:MAG TPA: hypothetical protein VNY05_10195 [Candidatus Acidoferrales bacterium]|nr:hypothetical protein [Candidatus Acidoferrales bacterium]
MSRLRPAARVPARRLGGVQVPQGAGTGYHWKLSESLRHGGGSGLTRNRVSVSSSVASMLTSCAAGRAKTLTALEITPADTQVFMRLSRT